VYACAEGIVRAELGAGTVHTPPLVGWFADQLARMTGFVAEDGAVVGFAIAEPHELHALYVDPDRWGTGVAAALHAALGLRDATLIVLAGNTRARRFYEKHGWTFDGDDDPRDFEGKMMPFARYRLARS
jgi:GNAT superfamily N-acetyltransferase